MKRAIWIAGMMVITGVLSGCLGPASDRQGPTPSGETGLYVAMGFNGTYWPRLEGTTLTILDHGAFGAYSEAKRLFENLTGARVEQIKADDAGSALRLAVQQAGNPTFDVIYGVDNILFSKALAEGIFEPYTPLLHPRVGERYRFFGDVRPWPATPVDHGYIAVNVDHRHPALAEGNVTIRSLSDLAHHASLFVTQDPRTSTPGLGFLLATIDVFQESGTYTWKDYWRELFGNGVLLTSGWTEAYEQHFSAGYGLAYGGAGDKPIVTSYSTSPAYEHYFERPAEALADVLVEPRASFHQIQTMGIVRGARNLAAAEAWIEFTLTDPFQELAAPSNAIYPVVPGIDVAPVFQGIDPPPDDLTPVSLDYRTIGENVERWVAEWVELCEAARCA